MPVDRSPNAGENPVVTPILPVRLGQGEVHYAQGIRAGRWVFATGCLGQDFRTGIAPDVLASRTPHAGRPKREKEAARIFDHLRRVLAEGGTDLGNMVRTDQYYTTVDAVPAYQTQRRQALGSLIPPSTSIAMEGLILPDADICVNAIAAVPDGDVAVEHISHETLRARETSGYSTALTAGPFVFVPGCTSLAIGDEPRRNGVAEAALMPEGLQWGGQPIKLETEFIVTQRLVPSLELAGARLEDVVKAQVYLTDPDDYSAFYDVWFRYFGEDGPALSVIPCSRRGLAVIDGKIEINIIARRPDTPARHIDAGVVPGFHRQPQAVKAADLLFVSGLMAADEDGFAAPADDRQPYFSCAAEAEAEHIVDSLSRLCRAAGTSLSNAVRIQLFLTDLASFYPVYRVLEDALGGAPVPFSVVAVPGPLPLPGATVLMDVWVYAPEDAPA